MIWKMYNRISTILSILFFIVVNLLLLQYRLFSPISSAIYAQFKPMVPKKSGNYHARNTSNPQETVLVGELLISTKLQDSNLLTSQSYLEGTCSEKAWLSGGHQKVISYSFYNSGPRYWKGINQILATIPTFYPGWQMRIYAHTEDILFLENKVNVTDFLFFCDIDHLSMSLKYLASCPLRMWRFAAMGDPHIDVVVFRDSDSEILQREVDAVSEWLHETNKTLHIMRDHPAHGTQILAGMWGLRMTKTNRKNIRHLRNEMFRRGYSAPPKPWTDQTLLMLVVWPAFANDFIAHDSYLCQSYRGSSPWPTQREGKSYVGAIINLKKNSTKPEVNKVCPIECRPKMHLDWEYC